MIVIFKVINFSFHCTFREEQSLFFLQTVKRREAGVNKCFLGLELHICAVCLYKVLKFIFLFAVIIVTSHLQMFGAVVL